MRNEANAIDKLLTPAQAAERLDVSVHWVYNLIKTGVMKAELFPRGQRNVYRLRESVVTDYIASREIPESLPVRTAA